MIVALGILNLTASPGSINTLVDKLNGVGVPASAEDPIRTTACSRYPRFRFITPGAVAAATLWIAGSALFGLYASGFSSYNKAWGSLASVIVTLTWLWLCSVAILFAAEVNAELERTREIHAGTQPSETLTVDHK